ncbi:cell wall-binding repeat-containing protein [Neobacillus drentensis]|uniref:cell wall-binding repeat-containing protein n=1 Tax=Neobacillus drentensis TaxID=220684 RepID=UPI00300036F3
MKNNTRLFTSLMATLTLVFGSLVPVVKAETFDQIQKQSITQLQQNSNQLSVVNQAATAQTVATQVTYTHQIHPNENNEYVFKTEGGSFEVKALHPVVEGLEFLIYNTETEETISPSSTGVFSLTAGTYVFLVLNYSDTVLNYEYVVNGQFSEQPDVTLPSLQTTSPSKSDIRLEKGASKVFTFSGSSDADELKLYSSTDEITLTAPGTFQQNVTLRNGYNFYSLNATEKSGNAITSYYSVALPSVTRFQGKDRYEVSSNISKEFSAIGANNSGTIILARGDVFSDALSGGPLAYSEGAPILLTATLSLPDSVKEQIKQLGPERAVILGGTGSISPNVEMQLKALGVSTIERIGGKDRFAVSASVGERVSNIQESDTAIIASGEVFPDALSASSLAGPAGMPVLLVKSGEVPDSIQTYIKNHPEIKNFIVVGGPATVKETVVDQIKNLHSGAYVERISGKDRYDVSINVAKYGIENYGMDLSTVAVARGDLFPDALSGAPFANYFMAPILLTTTNTLETKVNSFLTSHSGETNNIYIFGGTGSVSQNTENQLNSLIK